MNNGLKTVLVALPILGLVGLVPFARSIIVPSFRAVDGDQRYQWHRVANEDEWKNFKVKYKGSEYCGECHDDKNETINASKHARIQCENCHGPALDHPDDPEMLAIDRSRELCLRCHAKLPYRPKVYAGLKTGPIPFKMQDPEEHNPGEECVECHDVHEANTP
jgi:predicted CXXCH cytochrome family protein